MGSTFWCAMTSLKILENEHTIQLIIPIPYIISILHLLIITANKPIRQNRYLRLGLLIVSVWLTVGLFLCSVTTSSDLFAVLQSSQTVGKLYWTRKESVWKVLLPSVTFKERFCRILQAAPASTNQAVENNVWHWLLGKKRMEIRTGSRWYSIPQLNSWLTIQITRNQVRGTALPIKNHVALDPITENIFTIFFQMCILRNLICGKYCFLLYHLYLVLGMT